MQNIMDGRHGLIGMAVQTSSWIGGSGDDHGDRGTGGGAGVDITGRLVTCGACTAIGWYIMQGLDIVHGGQGPMAAVAEGARRLLSEVSGFKCYRMCCVTAKSAMDMGIKIGWVTAVAGA